MPLSMEANRSSTRQRPESYENRVAGGLHHQLATNRIDFAVEISPNDIVKRRAVTWDGISAEIVQAIRDEEIEFRFRASSHHLFAVYERGSRRDGVSLVEGLPRSTLRKFERRLTFVPAGHEYYERQEPLSLARMVFFYFDSTQMPSHPEMAIGSTALAPRLFFENAALLNTALKLMSLIENADCNNRPYFEALGIVLAHEVVRLNVGAQRNEAPVRGGLTDWRRRIVAAYIEEHLAERMSLTTLARLARLSPYHFCRAFKQSFGLPPHRYQAVRRIEQARVLLANPELSVTYIGLALGFSLTSSFTTAFRKATGLTPSAYRRSFT